VIPVAYVIDWIASGGAGTEKQLLGTLARLDRRHFDPVLVCLTPTPWLRANAGRLPCDVETVDYRGFLDLGFVRVLQRLRGLLRRRRVRLVHTFFQEAPIICYLATRRLKSRPLLVASFRDLGLGGAEPWYHRLLQPMRPRIFRSYEGIVTNGQMIRKYVRETLPLDRTDIKVIHNGIDIPHDTPDEPEFYRTMAGKTVVGIAANLSPIKRHDVFLRAVAHARNDLGQRDLVGVVLGDGALAAPLRELRRSLGIDDAVHFLGSVPDVAAHLQGWEIAVLCSDREGFSNSILEYFVAGLPVIATAVGGNVELVSEANGIPIPPGDPAALGRAIVRLAGDPALRRRLGDRGRVEVARYSWAAHMSSLETYYRELLDGR
jgi:glycosyltransferase involved in cell wall biosynthesis